jgi:hypothetical protein
LSKLQGINMILTWTTLHWAGDNGFLWLIQCLVFLSMSPWFLDSIHINAYSNVTLHGMIDILDSNIHLLFSITSGTSMPRLPLALLQYMVHRGQTLVDPSSITIMIHTTLCLQWTYVDNSLQCWCRWIHLHVLIMFHDNNRHEAYMINSFSSFTLDDILLIHMTFKMSNHIGHNMCLDEWIAST